MWMKWKRKRSSSSEQRRNIKAPKLEEFHALVFLQGTTNNDNFQLQTVVSKLRTGIRSMGESSYPAGTDRNDDTLSSDTARLCYGKIDLTLHSSASTSVATGASSHEFDALIYAMTMPSDDTAMPPDHVLRFEQTCAVVHQKLPVILLLIPEDTTTRVTPDLRHRAADVVRLYRASLNYRRNARYADLFAHFMPRASAKYYKTINYLTESLTRITQANNLRLAGLLQDETTAATTIFEMEELNIDVDDDDEETRSRRDTTLTSITSDGSR